MIMMVIVMIAYSGGSALRTSVPLFSSTHTPLKPTHTFYIVKEAIDLSDGD